MRCLNCDDEGLTCSACLADREADDAVRYGAFDDVEADDDDDLTEDDDDVELVGGDGFQTCELCGDLLSAPESRNDGLGVGLCTDCQRESCPRCGCWELAACEGGCHWLFIDDDGHAVCSACATEEEAAWARNAAARAAEEREL